MVSQSRKSSVIGLLALTLGLGGHSRVLRTDAPLEQADPPVLLHTCLI
jgi:hypothetical protein